MALSNQFYIDLIGTLDKEKSKDQINRDIKDLQDKLNSVELTATIADAQLKDINDKLDNLSVKLNDVTIPDSVLQKLVNDINDALKNIQIGNINVNPNIGKNAGKVISDQFKDAISEVTSKEYEVSFTVDDTKFQDEVSKAIKKIQSEKNTVTSYRLNTKTYYDKDNDEYIEELKSATFQYTTATGEAINKTIQFNKKSKEWVESSATYSKSLDNVSAKVSNFADKQKKAAADYENSLSKIQSGINDKGVSKPITDQSHLNSLTRQMDEVRNAIANLRNASVDTFTDMRIEVERQITALENMERQYRNAENVATSLRTRNFDTVKSAQQEKFAAFVEKIKNSKITIDDFNTGFSQLQRTLNNGLVITNVNDLETLLNNVTNKEDLIEFLNLMDIVEARLNSLVVAKTTSNTDLKIAAEADRLKSSIEIFRTANPQVENFVHSINGADISINNLLVGLNNVGSSDAVRIIKKQFEAFTEAAKAAGIATKETTSEYENLLKRANQAIETNKYDSRIFGVKKDFSSIELNTPDLIPLLLSQKYKELIDLSKKFNVSLSDDDKVKTYQAIERLLPSIKNQLTEILQKSDIQSGIESGEFTAQIKQLKNDFLTLSGSVIQAEEDIKDVNKAYKELTSSSPEELIQNYMKFNDVLEKAKHELSIAKSEAKEYIDTFKRTSLRNDILDWLKNNTNATKAAKMEMQSYLAEVDSGKKITAYREKEIRAHIDTITTNMRQLGRLGDSVGETFKKNAKSFIQWTISSLTAMDLLNALRDVYGAVLEIDTAMTNLYKVTNETDARYEKFLTNACKNAKELGRSVSSLVEQTANWSKLGYSLDEAESLAQISSIYANVGEVDDDTAVSDIVTAMKAFNLEASDAIKIVDALNILGNKYATSAADLGAGLTRSASAMATAGLDLYKTLALLTGGSEITQNAEEFGNMLKVGSMRIRGMAGALEELGEEVDENVESISKMQTQILNLTHGDVNIFDTSGNFRDYYDIMEDIAEVYDKLSSTEQADLLETLFGKQRGNQGAALIQAFQSGQIQKAYQDVQKSAGSAYEEQSRWMDSLTAKTRQLEAALQSISKTLLDSEIPKLLLDLATNGISTLDSLIQKFGTLPSVISLAGGGLSLFKNVGNHKMFWFIHC